MTPDKEKPMTNVQANKIDGLKVGFKGELLLPSDDAYEGARQIWNAMIDKRPAINRTLIDTVRRKLIGWHPYVSLLGGETQHTADRNWKSRRKAPAFLPLSPFRMPGSTLRSIVALGLISLESVDTG